MAAYCTAASLELYLGRSLTDGESDAADAACLAATDYIDRYLGKSWQGQTIGGELQTVPPHGLVRLDWRPVASITSVTARALIVGTTPRVLTAGTDYELIDALNGLLLVGAYGSSRDAVISTTGRYGTVLTVAYVTASTPPASVALAANMIAASYAVGAQAASATARGIQKLKAGDAEITYDPIETAQRVPSHALALLDAYRPALSFA